MGLRIGIILAVLRVSGKVLVQIERFTMLRMGLYKTWSDFFMRRIERPSVDVDFVGLIVLSVVFNSAIEIVSSVICRFLPASILL